jgi:uncharacterized protein (TIGR02611 family)
LIVDRADPFLDEDEDVIQWVRARKANGKGAGFIYLTVKRVVIVWTGKPDGDTSVAWEEITSWGLRLDNRGGPLLGVETADRAHFAQVVAATGRMAQDVRSFVRRFAELAGPPDKELTHPEHGPFEHPSTVNVNAEKRSIGGLTKRFMITLLGAVMFSVGFLIIPLPGPWSLPLILGGLAVLASEYDWAKDALEWSKAKYQKARQKLKSRSGSSN